jgi:ergothioneine biosynthesis protein EgtB
MTTFATIERTASLLERYRDVRRTTESLVEPLEPEDMAVQSMPDASPTKWHLAHTTWFFETFVLKPAGVAPYHPLFEYLFNSYYNTVGPQWQRPQRGLLTRPTAAEVRRYRAHVDAAVERMLDSVDRLAVPAAVIELGLHHEQQHQELILTDLKHLWSHNPQHPVYQERPVEGSAIAGGVSEDWIDGPTGVLPIGHAGVGFAFDNECPQHDQLIRPFRMAGRRVTNREYASFVADDGYLRPELWLSDGWAVARERGWRAPLYWEERDGSWWVYTLNGLRPVVADEPVCHVSFFEADAYARWSHARLPSEAEWEVVARNKELAGQFLEDRRFHPSAGASGFYGEVWEWTASPYLAYPGYRPAAGALGEYNAKFMCNQFVLRGGSCATPRTHIRATYRNFFPADARWQFSGIRLVMDA